MTLKRGQTGTRSLNEVVNRPASYAVASLPPASANAGLIVHCTNGAGGSPCLAYSNGTNWLRILIGAAVAVE